MFVTPSRTAQPRIASAAGGRPSGEGSTRPSIPAAASAERAPASSVARPRQDGAEEREEERRRHEQSQGEAELRAQLQGKVVDVPRLVVFVVAVVRRVLENLRSSNHFSRAVCFGAVIGLCGVAVHSLVDFGLHMMVNALVFVTLVMMATAKIEREQS
jgi:hypothetical protein